MAHQPPVETPASTLKVATALIGAIFIVAIVLYGISNRRDETADVGGGAVVATGTPPQPAGGQQPSTPASNAGQPSTASNPSATTGQGPNPQDSPGGNAGNGKAPANA